jgi:hypothetical protein
VGRAQGVRGSEMERTKKAATSEGAALWRTTDGK